MIDNIKIDDLDGINLSGLREIAKNLDIKSVTKYKKDELIILIKSNLDKNNSCDIGKKDTSERIENDNIRACKVYQKFANKEEQVLFSNSL